MEVHLSKEDEAQLVQVAQSQGRNADALAQEILGDFVRGLAHFQNAVALGDDDIKAGRMQSHEQVGERVNKLLRPE
jgi:predicted transcriptional regulator